MANDNKEIGDIVKKSKILLLDIEGTTTSISFVKDKLFPYAEENVKQFLDDQWEKEDVKGVISDLRKLALEDKENSVDGVVAIPGEDASKEDQIEGLVNNVKWQMSSDRKTGALKLLQGLIWKQGYDKGDIKGHVYEDVSPALEQWHLVEEQKVYIYSSGSVQAQKLLFGQSIAGDLLRYIDGHFDTAIGAKQDAGSYTAIAEKIGCKSEEILFITDIVKEAEAARSAGLHVALVSREGNAPLPDEATAAFPVIHSFTQLTVSNKRKTEPQDEHPAKIKKTETETHVTTTPELQTRRENEESTTVVTATEEKNTEKTSEEPEKMDVEEQTVATNETTEEQNKTEEKPVCVETVIEEVTNEKETVDLVVCDIQPIVTEDKSEENVDKTEEKETEKMETDSVETTETSATEPNEKTNVKKDEEKAPVAEETPPIVVTEIEEVTNEKINEVTEIIDDIEPVVEEPATVEDIEELQNVGEVLEKECDEILSKVQDVTNLDNIPLKPLLNPIAEETMETDNVDPNDIVDRILDTELELEMKQCEDIDLNTVAEITEEAKTDTVEQNSVKEETSVTDSSIIETNNIVEEKVTENNIEASEVTEKKNEGKSSVETKVEGEDKKVEEIQKSETESKDSSTEQSSETVETEVLAESQENEKVADDKVESKVNEPQVNGKATNGDTEAVNLNGDASKEEELSSRLSENGDSKETVNGSNGDSTETEQGQGDSKVEAEVSDIKVKSVATDEPHTDPIEQPTEA